MNEKEHPETLEGEMYVTNCCSGIFDSADDDYRDIGWKTKRKGTIAYDVYGNIIAGSYPVFMQIKEYEDEYGEVTKWHQVMKENLLMRR